MTTLAPPAKRNEPTTGSASHGIHTYVRSTRREANNTGTAEHLIEEATHRLLASPLRSILFAVYRVWNTIKRYRHRAQNHKITHFTHLDLSIYLPTYGGPPETNCPGLAPKFNRFSPLILYEEALNGSG